MKKGIIIESKGKWTVVLTPHGEFCKIPFESSHTEGKEVFFHPMASTSFAAKRKWRPLTVRNISMVAACLLLLVMVFPLFGGPQAYAAVTIDINPSIELEVDEKSIVIEAHPLNQEGEILLETVEWRNLELSSVTLAIIDKAEVIGMMNQERQVIITTTFYEEDPKEIGEKWEVMLGDIASQVDQELTVVLVEGEEQWVKEAKEKHIAPGSYMMVKQAEKQGITIEQDDIEEGRIELTEPISGIKVIHTPPRKDEDSSDKNSSNSERKDIKEDKDDDKKSDKKDDKNRDKNDKEKQQLKQEDKKQKLEDKEQKKNAEQDRQDREKEEKDDKEDKDDRDVRDDREDKSDKEDEKNRNDREDKNESKQDDDQHGKDRADRGVQINDSEKNDDRKDSKDQRDKEDRDKRVDKENKDDREKKDKNDDRDEKDDKDDKDDSRRSEKD